jgi:hypothetical protein
MGSLFEGHTIHVEDHVVKMRVVWVGIEVLAEITPSSLIALFDVFSRFLASEMVDLSRVPNSLVK